MALGEVQMSGEMLAIIGAAVALGVGMFGSTRWIHKDVERVRTDLSKLDARLTGEMNKLDGRLSGEMKELEGRLDTRFDGLRDEMRESEGRLRGEVIKLEARLDKARDEMTERDAQLRDEMTAGFKLVADRLTGVGDRLSKVEGVIEGMFWSARNLPPDTAKEGVA